MAHKRFAPTLVSVWLAAFVALQLSVWCPPLRASESPTSSPAATPPETPPDSTRAKAKVKISGYIQVYYKARFEQSGDGETGHSAFRFGRVKLKFAGRVKPKLTYVVEIDPRSPQIAGVMRDCYLQWEFRPDQRLRVGQMKTPFGWENRQSTTELFTVSRTEVGELFGRGLTLRDIGVGWFGRVRLGDGFRLENEVTVTNGAGLGAQNDDDHRKNVFGRLGGRWKTDAATLSLGLSGATGTMNEPADPGPPPDPALSFDFDRVGIDVEWDTRRSFAVAEFARGTEKANLPDEGGSLAAWYALVAGKTRWDIGPVLRYDVFDEDITRWTAGGYYGLPGEALRFLVTYEIAKEEDLRDDDRLVVWSQILF